MACDWKSPNAKAAYQLRVSGKELEQIIEWLKIKDAPPAIIGLQEIDRAKQRDGKTNNARVLAESPGTHYGYSFAFLQPGKGNLGPDAHDPNRCRYSIELMNALTISAFWKLPLNWFSFVSQKS